MAPDGSIALVDAGGNRILVLTKDFRLRKEIASRMAYYCSVNNLNPSLVYQGIPGADLAEYAVNYATKEAKQTRRWPFRMIMKDIPFYHGKLTFRQWGGRTFVIMPSQPCVAELVGDKLVLRLWLGRGKIPAGTVNDGVAWDMQQPKTAWIWRDKNGDGIMQASEFEFGDWPTASCFMGAYIDAAGNLYIPDQYRKTNGVLEVPFGGLDEHGLPRYSWADARWVFELSAEERVTGTDGKPYPVQIASYFADAQGNRYITEAPDIFDYPFMDIGLRKYSPEGHLLWRAGRRQQGVTEKPGEFMFAGDLSGQVDNRYLFYIDYDGSMNCWDTDGLYVGRLFSDLPGELFLPGEDFHGVAFRHPNGKVYAYSSPDCQYCSTRIIVDGLERIERFTSRIQVTAVQPPRPARKEMREWHVLRRGDFPIRIDGEVTAREWNTDTSAQAPRSSSIKTRKSPAAGRNGTTTPSIWPGASKTTRRREFAARGYALAGRSGGVIDTRSDQRDIAGTG